MSQNSNLRALTTRVQVANKAVVRFASNTSKLGTKEDSKELRTVTLDLATKLVTHLIETGQELIKFGNDFGSSVFFISFYYHCYYLLFYVILVTL